MEFDKYNQEQTFLSDRWHAVMNPYIWRQGRRSQWNGPAHQELGINFKSVPNDPCPSGQAGMKKGPEL